MHTNESSIDDQASGRFLLGLVCGAAVGAALGLLLAPKPGLELRHQMSDSAQRMKARATQAYGEASTAVGDAVERGRKAFEAGREAFNDTRRQPSPPNTGVSVS
jgi:gas vesicle protein